MSKLIIAIINPDINKIHSTIHKMLANKFNIFLSFFPHTTAIIVSKMQLNTYTRVLFLGPGLIIKLIDCICKIANTINNIATDIPLIIAIFFDFRIVRFIVFSK